SCTWGCMREISSQKSGQNSSASKNPEGPSSPQISSWRRPRAFRIRSVKRSAPDSFRSSATKTQTADASVKPITVRKRWSGEGARFTSLFSMVATGSEGRRVMTQVRDDRNPSQPPGLCRHRDSIFVLGEAVFIEGNIDHSVSNVKKTTRCQKKVAPLTAGDALLGANESHTPGISQPLASNSD